MSCSALIYFIREHKGLLVHCAAATAAIVAGCDSLQPTKQETGSGTTVSVHFDRAAFERQRDAYRREAEKRLADMDNRLAELREKAKVATADAKVHLDKEIADQSVNLDRAKKELKEIDAVVGEKWAEFEHRSSKALDDLRDGFDRAFSRFRE